MSNATLMIIEVACYGTLMQITRRWRTFSHGQRKRVAADIAQAERDGTLRGDLAIVAACVDWRNPR